MVDFKSSIIELLQNKSCFVGTDCANCNHLNKLSNKISFEIYKTKINNYAGIIKTSDDVIQALGKDGIVAQSLIDFVEGNWKFGMQGDILKI